jgi:3-hydroxyisobutyrate dehydrogenase
VQIIMVGFDEEIKQIMFDTNGLLPHSKPGNIIVISSTAKPQNMISWGKSAAEKGVGLLDAPVCRGGRGADEGTLLTLVGGDPELFESCHEIFSAYSSDICRAGSLGHGQVAKTVNNLMLWAGAVATYEGFSLAKSFGADLPLLREAILKSSGRCGALNNWDNMTFQWALKDMNIVLDMADDAGISLPLGGLLKEHVKPVKELRKGITFKTQHTH